MKIIGFNFSKVHAEKMKRFETEMKVHTSLDIVDIREIDSGLIETSEKILEAKFVYDVLYEPGAAKVSLGGHILFSVDQKMGQEIVTQWKKKQMSENLRLALLNIIMKKAGPRAVILEDEMNLPLHVPFPSLRKEEPKKK